MADTEEQVPGGNVEHAQVLLQPVVSPQVVPPPALEQGSRNERSSSARTWGIASVSIMFLARFVCFYSFGIGLLCFLY
jgi:hypothetical protein